MKVTRIDIEHIKGLPEIGKRGHVCIGYRDTDDHAYTITISADVLRSMMKAYHKSEEEKWKAYHKSEEEKWKAYHKSEEEKWGPLP